MLPSTPLTSKPAFAGGVLALAAGMICFIFNGWLEALLLPFIYLYILLLVYDWKMAYWLLLSSIPLSVHIELNDTLSTSVPDEPMIWLYFILFFLLVAHRPDSLPVWFLSHPLTIVIALQFVWLFVACVFSQAFIPSAKFFIAKSWYLVCFYAFPIWIFRDKQDIKWAFRSLLVPICLSVVFITWKHADYDFSFLSVNWAIGKLYYNHVEYGAILSMFFPILIIAVLLSRDRKLAWRFAAFVVVAVFSVVLFITYARAALLGVAFAAIVAFGIRLRLVNFIMPAMYLVIATGIYFLAHDSKYTEFTPDYEHTYMRKNLAEHLRATLQGQDMSSMERVYRWIAAARMSNEHPLTGFGPHGFVDHYKSYTVPAFRTYVSDNPERSTTHNYFLLMLTEQGWPAMLLYALLTPLAFAQAQCTYHRFKDRFYKLCTLAVVMMLASCFVNNFFSELIETHKVAAMFYLGLSLLVILSHKSRQLPVAGNID